MCPGLATVAAEGYGFRHSIVKQGQSNLEFLNQARLACVCMCAKTF
jgi:hypothetical protein